MKWNSKKLLLRNKGKTKRQLLRKRSVLNTRKLSALKLKFKLRPRQRH